jgi:hypothetical protein
MRLPCETKTAELTRLSLSLQPATISLPPEFGGLSVYTRIG